MDDTLEEEELDHEAMRLLINIYMIKKLNTSPEPVNQAEFIKDVYKPFHFRGYRYSCRTILIAWKGLLEKYRHYKQNYSWEEALKEWRYFPLMDNCFDDRIIPNNKFSDPQWTFLIIELMKDHKPELSEHGLTLDILCAVEKELRKQGNTDILAKDIYIQWNSLRKSFIKFFQKPNKRSTFSIFFEAMKGFVDFDKTSAKRKTTDIPDTDSPKRTCSILFTKQMLEILIQAVTKRTREVETLKGLLDDETVNSALEALQESKYEVTKESVMNEWKDLFSRYQLLKNTENPCLLWPYFSEMNSIYDEVCYEDLEEQPAELSNKVLEAYKTGLQEALEIKEVFQESNSLKVETNCLFGLLATKIAERNKCAKNC